MGVLKIALLALACIGSALGQNWEDYNGFWYSVSVGKTYNWHDARAMCLSYGGELASITEVNEKDKIQEMMDKTSYTGPFWIGLNNLDRVKWSWSDGTKTVPSFWADGFPTDVNKYGEYELCGAQEKSSWKNQHCDMEAAFVCKAPRGAGEAKTVPPTPSTAGFCPPGYFDGLSRENKCFKIVWPADENMVTWSEAVNRCRGGPGLRPDLASVVDERESAVLTTQMQTIKKGVWIGLSRQNDQRNWRWADNSPVSDYTNWGPNEPSGWSDNCAEIWFTPGPPGTWNNINCASKRGYVCQTFKDPSNVVNTPEPNPNTCDEGYFPYWYGCYKFLPANETWTKQEQMCQQDGGHLASIHYEAENAALHTKVLELGKPVWIGFKDFQGLGLFEWSDAWQAFYTKWGENEPGRAADKQGGCVIMKPDGRWYNVFCDIGYSAICKKTTAPPITTPAPKEGLCPGEQFGKTDWVKHGAYCYLRITDWRTWQSAKEECVKRDPRASLASIHSYPENQFVFDYLGGNGNFENSYWIGMFRGQSNEFAWSDQSAVIYENWAPGEPNGEESGEDCVEIYIRNAYVSYWNDHSCTSYRPFLCKVPQADPIPPPENVDGTCPEGWVEYDEGAHCYRFMGTLVGEWMTAYSACQQYDARLPIINNFVEAEWIRSEIEERNEHPTGVTWNYWTGLVRDRDAGTGIFKWVDGTRLESSVYNQWNSNEPKDRTGKEDCVEAQQSDGKWNAIVCDVPKSFVCQIDKTPLNKPLTAGAIVGIIFGVIAIIFLVIAITVIALDRLGVISIPLLKKKEDTSKLVASGFENDNYHGGDKGSEA